MIKEDMVTTTENPVKKEKLFSLIGSFNTKYDGRLTIDFILTSRSQSLSASSRSRLYGQSTRFVILILSYLSYSGKIKKKQLKISYRETSL